MEQRKDLLATLTVCTTCRRIQGGDPSLEEPRPGAKLLAALERHPLPKGLTLRGTECLSACGEGSVIALTGVGKWSYVYGRMGPHDAVEILDGAARYAATEDGVVPWRERPEIFRKQSVARIPPQE